VKDYRWNDALTEKDAGSPNLGQGEVSEFGTPGCLKIFEVDTVSGVLTQPRVTEPPLQTTPVYCNTFTDFVTGLQEFKASDGRRYWIVETGADRYQDDVYERPTTALYKTIDGKFATAEYYSYLDLVDAKVGYNSQFLYVSVRVNGLDARKSDGTD